MSNRYPEQQRQRRSDLPEEREERKSGAPPMERDTSRPPAPNREGAGPALPLSIILGLVVIFILIFAIVLI